jgi:WD40 repeat protein
VLRAGQSSAVNAVAWSPVGRWPASGSHDCGATWESHTGQEQQRLEGHAVLVNSVSSSPDGRWLTSASADATLRVRGAPRPPFS